eukprot:Hpha_TRINITY_DN15997_c9_g1::TRINITY_DN15997_c9_g1_i2::g.70302::m.70302
MAQLKRGSGAGGQGWFSAAPPASGQASFGGLRQAGMDGLKHMVGNAITASGGYSSVPSGEPSDARAAAVAGRSDVPFVTQTTVNEHPDTLLRRMGLVEQFGRYRKHCSFVDVYYDWARVDAHGKPQPAWCRTNLPGSEIDVPLKKIKQRSDHTKTCVIRLVGHVDFQSLVRKERERKRRHKSQVQGDTEAHLKAFLEHRKRKRRADPGREKDSDEDEDQEGEFASTAAEGQSMEKEQLKAVSLQQQGFVDAADDLMEDGKNLVEAEADGDLLTTDDVVRFVRQYLQRSIPSKAIECDAIVLTSGAGDISTNLAKGVKAVQDGGSGSRITVVGIHPWDKRLEDTGETETQLGTALQREGAQQAVNVKDLEREVYTEAMLNPAFSHHVLVQAAPVVGSPETKFSTPTGKEFLDATIAIVGELSKGFNVGDKARNEKVGQEGIPLPPPRMPLRVTTVLIGGNKETTKFDLIHSVRKRWPILILEGTGGYADLLCDKIKSVELTSDGIPTADDFKSILASTDALTAEIIIEGELHVISKGTQPEAFGRELQRALQGDETLARAWEKYAAWNQQGSRFEKYYMNFMVTILMLGICATALSIFQTYLMLRYPTQTIKIPGNESASWFSDSGRPVAVTYGICNISIIVLPVAVQLVQSIANKYNSGAKWVSLRSAAESTLTEIYMYRTQTRSYSQHAVQRARDRKAKGLIEIADNEPIGAEEEEEAEGK